MGCGGSKPEDNSVRLANAAWDGRTDECRTLLQQGTPTDGGFAHGHHSPLNAASRNGHLEIVRLLLEMGQPDMESRCQPPWSVTPLHQAAACWHHHPQNLEIVKLLLAHGADTNARAGDAENCRHRTAREFAEQDKRGRWQEVVVAIDEANAGGAQRADSSPVAVMGYVVQGTAVASPTAPPMILIAQAELLKSQLGLSGNVADVIRQSCEQLGVDAKGKPLTEAATLCLYTLGVAPEQQPLLEVVTPAFTDPEAALCSLASPACYVLEGGTFSDDDRRLVLPKNLTLAGRSFTVSMRVKRGSNDKTAPLFCQLPTDDIAGGPRVYTHDTMPFAYLGSAKSGWPALRFGFWGDDLTHGDRGSVCQHADQHTFVHYVFTFDAQSFERRAYRDGGLLSVDRAHGVPRPSGPLMLGHMSDGRSSKLGYSAKLVGTLSHVCVWDVCLTDEQVGCTHGMLAHQTMWPPHVQQALSGQLLMRTVGELVLQRRDGGGAWAPPGYGHGGKKMD